MRVVFWGTYDKGKPRTRILQDGLRANGVEVDEIHADVWKGIEDKSQVRGFAAKLRIMVRWLFAYPGLSLAIAAYGASGVAPDRLSGPSRRVRDCAACEDAPHPGRVGHLLSVYDTVCEDRRLLEPRSIRARLLRWLERTALRRADLLFMDTQAHARRLEQLFGLPDGCCDAVWVGVETRFFSRLAPSKRGPGASAMRVLFYGQFIPLHGIATIIAAAALLRDRPISGSWWDRGRRPERIRKMLIDDPLPHVQWTDWLDYAQLNRRIAEADLCLGIFGTSDKAASVIPNKVFQIVATGRPLITRDSPAIRELLSSSRAVHLSCFPR